MPSAWTTKIELRDELPTILASIRGPLGRVKRTRLIVDTGSCVTILDGGLAVSVDLTADRSIGRSRIIGPAGEELGYWILAPTLTIMGRDLADREVCVHDLVELDVDGIVGMDILSQGRLVLDTPAAVLQFVWTATAVTP